ncbi:MAG TPA: glycosyltransferase, partial [Aggregatilineales bacterium]|nr:glycosyltransferase [Aggregatilineales bacterium]
PRREPLSPELAAIPSAPRKPPKIMLMASPPAQIIETLRGLPPALRRAPYRLALWAWERDSFPAAWRALCAVAGINEVWTISHFARTVIAAAVDVPVVRIPIPGDARPTVGISRAALGLPERRFVVFFSFSAASTAARKNPFGVIEAFRRAFGRPAEGDPDSPLLVIRAHHLDQHDAKGLAAPLRQGVAGVGGKLLEGRLSHQAVVDRIALSDCYLSLHRAEGFGLGMAEAMGVGVPVIGTGYSGSMDFLTAETGFPIRYRLRPIHEDDHRYQPHLHTLYPPGDSQWAEPDLDHAAECLRFLYMNRSTARAQTERGQRLIETEYSPAAVGAFMAARLAHVGISTL